MRRTIVFFNVSIFVSLSRVGRAFEDQARPVFSGTDAYYVSVSDVVHIRTHTKGPPFKLHGQLGTLVRNVLYPAPPPHQQPAAVSKQSALQPLMLSEQETRSVDKWCTDGINRAEADLVMVSSTEQFIDPESIRANLRGMLRNAGGTVWRYSEDKGFVLTTADQVLGGTDVIIAEIGEAAVSLPYKFLQSERDLCVLLQAPPTVLKADTEDAEQHVIRVLGNPFKATIVLWFDGPADAAPKAADALGVLLKSLPKDMFRVLSHNIVLVHAPLVPVAARMATGDALEHVEKKVDGVVQRVADVEKKVDGLQSMMGLLLALVVYQLFFLLRDRDKAATPSTATTTAPGDNTVGAPAPTTTTAAPGDNTVGAPAPTTTTTAPGDNTVGAPAPTTTTAAPGDNTVGAPAPTTTTAAPGDKTSENTVGGIAATATPTTLSANDTSSSSTRDPTLTTSVTRKSTNGGSSGGLHHHYS